jgi:hypothetical protein
MYHDGGRDASSGTQVVYCADKIGFHCQYQKDSCHIQMNKKQATMLVTETLRQIDVANRDGKDATNDDDEASGDPQEQNAGNQMAGRPRKI